MDSLDEAIIQALLEDALQTNVKLAGKLNCSESTIRRRRKQLMEEGILQFAVVSNPFKLGYNVMALIGLQVHRTYHRQVEQALVDLPELRFVGATLGSFDLLIEGWFRSQDELVRFIEGHLDNLPGLKRTETIQIYRILKYTYDWPTVGEAKEGSA